MAAQTRKYDIAFSFLKADLPLALRLADAVEPLTSFVYAERQDEIILQDGMDVFGAVFGHEARLNVVLYRAGYGDRGWTNFEREAIKGRCLGNEGWGSFALLQADDTPVPAWVPPTYIYGDASMSIEVLAGVLRHRAKLAGASVRNETAADRLARLAATKTFELETEQLATGPDAHSELRTNLDLLFHHISQVIEEHSKAGLALIGASGLGAGVFGANLGSVGCFINYQNPYGRVTGGKLVIRFFSDNVPIPGSGKITMGRIPESGTTTVDVIRSRALGWCWDLRGLPRTSLELAEYVLDEMIRRNR